MPRHRKFLVIDDNADSRFLLVKTLLRKFPQAVIHESQDADAAILMAATPGLDAIVTHRAVEVDGVTLVSLLRKANPAVPIIMVSGINRSLEANAAGATRFLNYDEWLRIGTVVSEALTADAKPEIPKIGDDVPRAGTAAPGA
ncbi:MAG: response regulator [Opitutaceae bacterium]|nr:response regulator [Opitutaceae bacterium]